MWIAPEAIWESMAHLHSPKQDAVRQSLLKGARAAETETERWMLKIIVIQMRNRTVLTWKKEDVST